MSFEENKSTIDLEYGSVEMPFDLNKLMNLQFDTLKHAIEWLVQQQQKTNTKINGLETMSRPGYPQGMSPSSNNGGDNGGPPELPQVIEMDPGGGIDPEKFNQAIMQVME